MDALKISGLHAYYGKAHILQGVDLTLLAGSVVGLLGRNGAGKTTFLKAIMQLVPRVEGSVFFFDRPVDTLRTDEIARAGIAYMSQDMRVFPELTIEENCRVAANTVAKARPMEEILEILPELKPMLTRPAGRLSGGQQQLVALARSMTMNCRVLLMDEPTEGLMPKLVERIGRLICSLAEQAVSVLLVEQNVGLSLASCNHLYLMEKGRIVGSGTVDQIVSAGMLERHLGITHHT